MTAPLERFRVALDQLGATAPTDRLGADLAAAWAEPGREYHDTAHLLACLRELDAAPTGQASPAQVEAALWFHDAVYDPRWSDNEVRSARWAADGLESVGVGAETAAEVARLVLLTRHLEPATDPAGALVCDIDLSILGRPVDEYEDFERRIRAEYAWVPEPLYRQERGKVLARFLARDPLYRTAYFRESYEASARRNLERALARLRER